MTLRILSYNLFWKAMTGHIAQCPLTDSGLTVCAQHASTFVNDLGPYDFVCLQEAKRWQLLVKGTPALSSMRAVSYQPGLSPIVTLYSTKFELDPTLNQLTGYSTGTGRPFIMLFFTNGLGVLNLHADHHDDVYNLQATLERSLNSLEQLDAEQIISKLQTYDLIVAGDMNSTLVARGTPRLFGRRLYGPTTQSTCCDQTLRAARFTYASDHVLSTSNSVRTQVYRVPNASDHRPIIADIDLQLKQQIGGRSRNIAYDFDGVLHRTVTAPTACGERSNIEGHVLEPFTEILDQIRADILSDNRVFIITARSPDLAPQLHAFIAGTNLAPLADRIRYYFTSGQSKIPLLAVNRINVFYDDSCRHITEVYANHHILPDLEELYLTNPESQSWVLITAQNIGRLCPPSQDPTQAAYCRLYVALSARAPIDTITDLTRTLVQLKPDLLADPYLQHLIMTLRQQLSTSASSQVIKTQYAIAERLVTHMFANDTPD